MCKTARVMFTSLRLLVVHLKWTGLLVSQVIFLVTLYRMEHWTSQLKVSLFTMKRLQNTCFIPCIICLILICIIAVAPSITQTTTNPVVVEGSNLNLTCNVSGTTPLNVTWTRSGKPAIQGMVYSITNIKRSDEGVYRCTVNNGAECPERSATTNATVKCEMTFSSFYRVVFKMPLVLHLCGLNYCQ